MVERFLSSARIAIPGVVKASGSAAAGFESLGRVAQDQFNQQLEQESKSSFDEGALAGVGRDEAGNLTAAFTGDSDMLSKSYDDGVASTYLSSLLQDSSMFIAEKRREFAEDPDGFRDAVSIYGNQQAGKVPERLRADFMLNFEQDFGNSYNSLADDAAQRALNNAQDTAGIEATRRINMMAESISKYDSPTDLMMASFRKFLEGTGAAMTDDGRHTFMRVALVATTEQRALNALMLTQEPGTKAGVYDHTTVKALTDAIRSGGDTSAFDNLDLGDLSFDEREVVAQTVDQKVSRDRAEQALVDADQRGELAIDKANQTAFEAQQDVAARFLNDSTVLAIEDIQVNINSGNKNVAMKVATDQLSKIETEFRAGTIRDEHYLAQRAKVIGYLDQISKATNEETEAVNRMVRELNDGTWVIAPTDKNYTALFERMGGVKALSSDRPEVVNTMIASLSVAASVYTTLPPQIEFMFKNGQTLSPAEVISLGRLWGHLKRGDSGNAYLPSVTPEMEQFWDRQENAYNNGAGSDRGVIEAAQTDLAALTLNDRPPNRDQLFQAFSVEDDDELWNTVADLSDVGRKVPGNGYFEAIGSAFANSSNTFSGVKAMWDAAWNTNGYQLPVELEDSIKANYLHRASAYPPTKEGQAAALDYAVQASLQSGFWSMTNIGGTVRMMKYAPEATSASTVVADADVPQDLWQTKALYDQLKAQGRTDLVWHDWQKEFATANAREKNRSLRHDRVDPETGQHIYRYWSADAGHGVMRDIGIDIVFDAEQSPFVQQIKDIAEKNDDINNAVWRRFSTHIDIYYAANDLQDENQVGHTGFTGRIKGFFEDWGDEINVWSQGKRAEESWGEYVLRSAPEQAANMTLQAGKANGHIMGEILRFSGVLPESTRGD